MNIILLPRYVYILHKPTVVCSAVRRWVIAFVFTDALMQHCLIIFMKCGVQEERPTQKTGLSVQSVCSSSSHNSLPPPPHTQLAPPILPQSTVLS
jgi:hypothetical protein